MLIELLVEVETNFFIMVSFINSYKLFAIGLLLSAAAGYMVANFLGQEKLEDVTHSTRLETAEQLTVLATLTEIMARGGADQVTEQVIRDCSSSERTRYDDLLARLAEGLSRTELSEVSRLFDRCGYFFSQQRAVMAARFAREVEIFNNAVARQALLLGDDSVAEYALDDWQQLAQLEKEQSELFTRLVVLQGDIIAALIDGEAATGQKNVILLNEVKEVVEMQSYNALKMNELRGRLPTAL